MRTKTTSQRLQQATERRQKRADSIVQKFLNAAEGDAEKARQLLYELLESKLPDWISFGMLSTYNLWYVAHMTMKFYTDEELDLFLKEHQTTQQ